MENKNQTVQIEARTIELALQKAALTLGVSQERLGYEVVKDNSNGIMSLLTGRRVQINAWRKVGQRSASQSQNNYDERSDDSEQSDSSGGGRYRSDRQGQGRQRSSGRNDNRGDGRGDGRSDNRRHGSGGGGGYSDNRRSRSNSNSSSQGQNGGGYYSSNKAPRRHSEDRDHDTESAPQTPPRILAPEEIESLRVEILEFWQGICERMVGESVSVEANIVEDRLCLNAENEYLASQLAKNIKLAESFEHLLRKKPRHLQQEMPFRIFVDISGVRKQREDELVQMAKDLSEKVHENKRPIVLNYKSPYERKIIHMALDKDERVYTKSIGSGPGRKLMILPSQGGPSGEEMFESSNL